MTQQKHKDNEQCILTIILDGEEKTIIVPKTTTIIDAALEADMDPPYSCQGGFCTSCMAVITEGKAEMDENDTLNDDEISEGKILTCVARPTTDKVVVNFDL